MCGVCMYVCCLSLVDLFVWGRCLVQVSGMVSIYWICAAGAGIRDALRPPLRSRYQEGAFLQALHKALPKLYSLAPPACTPLLPLVQLHAMVTQHSLFLPTLLAAVDGGGPDAGVKGEVPELFRQCWATGHPWVWSGGSDVGVGRSPERARRCSAPRSLSNGCSPFQRQHPLAQCWGESAGPYPPGAPFVQSQNQNSKFCRNPWGGDHERWGARFQGSQVGKPMGSPCVGRSSLELGVAL